MRKVVPEFHRTRTVGILLPAIAFLLTSSSVVRAAGSSPGQRQRSRARSSQTICRIDSISEPLVEGGTFEVVVYAALPPRSGLVRLNCELKAGGAEVIQAHRSMVRGKSRHRFTFDVPPHREARHLQVFAWLGTDWRQPRVPIVSSDRMPVMTKESLARRKRLKAESEKLLAKLDVDAKKSGNVALLAGNWAGQDRGLIDQLDDALRQEGYRVARVDARALLNLFVVTPERFDLFVLTGAGSLPREAAETIRGYLRDGGNLLALGAPLFADPLQRIRDRWMSKQDIAAELGKARPATMLFDFESGDLSEWTRASDRPSDPTTYRNVDGGAAGTKRGMHVKIDNLTGWETIYGTELPQGAIKGDQALTCFWAKGGPKTTRLAVEWDERDGSRWIATVPLTDKWQHYVLPAERFAYWRDSSSKGRGGSGDAFNPANARRVGFGLAFTHTGHLSGAHEFRIDQVGMAPSPLGQDIQSGPPEFPPTDLLWPGYKYYDTRDVGRIRANRMQGLIDPPSLPLPTALRCPHQRPQGTGFHKGRAWRMITVCEAVSDSGDFRGPALAVRVEAPDKGKAHTIAAVGTDDLAFLRAPQTIRALTDVAKRMIDGLFLLEGGSEFYTYFQRESIKLGARVVHAGRRGEADVEVRIRVMAGSAEVFGQAFAGTVRAGGTPAVFECTWGPDRLNPKGYNVVVELRHRGRLIDRLGHPLGVWQPKADPQFVTARDGDFYLAGRKWVPFGVNHMPSSGIGTEDGKYFEQYLGARAYDPEIVDRELARIKALGMNMVSHFLYHESHPDRNLLDLLRRCEKHGLKVNLSLRPGTPMDFRWDEVRQMIVENRLAENDTVMAYDLAWEPFVGRHDQRKRWDLRWGEWVQRKYGTIQNAERAWGFKAPRTKEGFLSNPLDKHCGGDGPWGKMVVDYRRFIDELAHEYYSRARELVRTVDKNHLVSFRMTVAGDPTFDPSHNMPFDFRSLKDAVDIFEPEGYGRIGDWQRVKPGMFTVAYARAVNPKLPVLWAEYGVSTWNMDRMETSERGLAFQARFFDDFLRMVERSGANGAVCWWYPGGFRVGENSDFGIVNPDGTDRPVAKVLRKYARLLTESTERPKPEVWIEYDPDDPGGVHGIYEKVKDEYWKAVEQGKLPGLRAKKK